ncbi:DUF3017 domain-containing protein [Streptomyces tubbatahanensis]|uniref:DUF3017 domain-containing protein n=1 Tax=Streptomyces tubbatahanensis TaxID=2923272 RepID=A0ABY3XVQ0_9ACTN|nr:DUF3017 domain-containing protein [Streptomyces tubbatahanensis]UNS98542.1 DUF3017 domain-containing protein [Streptomyces tubbatahanensis]
MSKENEAGTKPATRTEKTADAEQPAAGGEQSPAGEQSAAGGEQSPAGEQSAADGQRAAAAGEPPSDGRQQSAAAPRRRSRRFPVLTRDTARPEGGGRAVGGHHPAPYRQWPLLAVCAGVLVGLLVTVIEFRSGTLIIGLALLGGAVLRWAKPSVGMLAVRSRFTDMVLYGVLGLVIVLLALMAQPKPLLTVPFLDTIVHFTVR